MNDQPMASVIVTSGACGSACEDVSSTAAPPSPASTPSGQSASQRRRDVRSRSTTEAEGV